MGTSTLIENRKIERVASPEESLRLVLTHTDTETLREILKLVKAKKMDNFSLLDVRPGRNSAWYNLSKRERDRFSLAIEKVLSLEITDDLRDKIQAEIYSIFAYRRKKLPLVV